MLRKKLYAYENYEGDKGIIIATSYKKAEQIYQKVYLAGGDFPNSVNEVFSYCIGSDWSNVIFKNHTDLDFSELEHRRIGVHYQTNGIVINYNGSYQQKKLWKYIRMNFAEIAAEIEKRIQQ